MDLHTGIWLILCKEIHGLAKNKILRGLKVLPLTRLSADPSHTAAAFESASFNKQVSGAFLGLRAGKQIHLATTAQKARCDGGVCMQGQRASVDTMGSMSFVPLQALLAALLIALICKVRGSVKHLAGEEP